MALPQDVQRKIYGIENLATLPNIATEIMEMIRRSSTSMREIARVIEKDASITAKIIKVSNSPLWGFQGRIDNVQRALVLLGLKQVTNIVIAVSLYSTFSKLKPNPYFDREKFWLHSAGTGQIARAFSRKLGLNFHGEDFVAALIHDIGKMVLDQFFSEKFHHILEYAHETGREVVEVEREVLGCTHADIGGWLLKHWNFPETIVQAVQWHHTPSRAHSHKELAAIIHLSEILCELWGIGFDDDIKAMNVSRNEGWQILKNHSPKLAHLDVERFVLDLYLEIEKAKLFIQLIGD